jgi:phage-related protein
MERSTDLNKLAQKLLSTAEKTFREKGTIDFSVYTYFTPESWDWFISVKVNDDDDKEFAFTYEQVRKWLPNLGYGLQFSSDENYLYFARTLIQYFAEAIEEINNTQVIRVMVKEEDNGNT